MRIIALLILFNIAGFVLFTEVSAQERPDTIVRSGIDTSGKNVLALDTAIKKTHDPRKATLRSAILPGWGQAYNKKYWKIPIVYAALGTTAGVFFYNIRSYQEARQAVIYRSDGDTTNDHLISPDLAAYNTESIRRYRNVLRQNIDYSVLVFLVFWALNVVDATVDAHLKAFDVSPDISMKIKPGFNYLNRGAGLSLVFSLKHANDKPMKPLP